MWIRIFSAVAIGLVPLASEAAPAPALTLDTVNATEFQATPPAPKGKARSGKDQRAAQVDPVMAKAQILLDRAGFSPGAIDARDGDNLKKALAAFQQYNGLESTGALDPDSWAKLTATSQDPVLITYEITDADLKGPFEKKIPPKLEQMAELKRLSYRTSREMLAERFHMDEGLLQALNPKATFDEAGASIVVANVALPAPKAKVARVEIRKGERALRAFDPDGQLLAFYPVSIGSGEKPAPTGNFKVTGVAENPWYQYDPKYAFKGVKAKKKFKVAPGPNNPVGAVWINLSVESYGIHGTPEPTRISKTESHGCVRMTNWDVQRLGKMVDKSTAVDFVE